MSKQVAETCAAQMCAEKTSFQGAELRVMMKREWEASKRTFRVEQRLLSTSSKYAAAAASASRSTFSNVCSTFSNVCFVVPLFRNCNI